MRLTDDGFLVLDSSSCIVILSAGVKIVQKNERCVISASCGNEKDIKRSKISQTKSFYSGIIYVCDKQVTMI